MKKLQNTFKKVFRNWRSKAVLVVVASGIVLMSGVANAGWTPSRPVYNWNNTSQRKGSMNGPVWNSFINTPYYGDERTFFDSARTDLASGEDAFKDVSTNVTAGSKKVILRTYIHNNANQSTNASGTGVAHNAKVRIDLPTGTSKMLRARSYISSSNAAPGFPKQVTDTTELVASTPFALDYVEGSAKIYNHAHPASANGLTLPDSIVGSGAKIGYSSMNGDVPGCFEFQAMVEITVNIVQPDIEFEKDVRKDGDTSYTESTTVNPGEKVQWRVHFKNDGATTVNNVNVRDIMPPHMDLVNGSVRYIYRGTDGEDHDVVQSNTQLFTTGGFSTGTWNPGGGFYLRFDSIADDDFDTCEVTVRNRAQFTSTQNPAYQSDTADVRIVKEDCDEDEETPPEEEKPPVTPAKETKPPKVLPNTGAGSVVGIFLGTTLLAGLAHRLVIGRKFNA